MQESPFSNLIQKKGNLEEGYIEMIELTGTAQEKKDQYVKIVNEKLNSMLERPFFDSTVKRTYYYRVSSFGIEKIDDASYAMIYYEPSFRTSVSRLQERYDEATGE